MTAIISGGSSSAAVVEDVDVDMTATSWVVGVVDVMHVPHSTGHMTLAYAAVAAFVHTPMSVVPQS